ncbi:hypothetical protein AVT69_gp023 [Pseudomonas phage PhiPA3]|uniref:Uncharacterized protein 023 n=1 Tax=Pseudomonas phage PhiPA3 TaxID=998086 RepID=F8SJQ4_BPPA3|nr:hypothetical protein AVT69_gp023 [Pseudomonas phage PhiPA3]AEH03449.1 hypothetical protein [Pseudomonas phage PhiPA3]
MGGMGLGVPTPSSIKIGHIGIFPLNLAKAKNKEIIYGTPPKGPPTYNYYLSE